MFTKNIKDFFSDDLLNTVRSVVSEEKKKKHEKNCGCDECEIEMKEGFASAAQRKAVWATYADGGKGHPDKKKKMKKEEVELEEGKMKELVTKHMDAGHDYEAAMKKAKKDLEKMKEEAEQIDELSKKTLGSYVKKAAHQAASKGTAGGMSLGRGNNPDDEAAGIKSINKAYKRTQGISKAVDKLTKEEQEFIDALNNDMFEEIEIAEANLKVGDYTATSEKSKFHDKGYRPHLKNPQGKTSYLASVAYKTPEHAAGEAAAYHKGYTSGPGRASERGADDAVRAYRHKNKKHMHEEVELEEARGRPPKEGSAAWKARQQKADDDMVALGMQLRKARSINKKVRFMNGKEHNIHPNHINRFEDHMAARKSTQEKAAFQKQAHKSHDDFVKAVSAPIPKAEKHTSEIVKYR